MCPCEAGACAQPTPHTVTHVPGVGSFASPPIRRSRRLDVHTRSHTKLGSVLSSSLQHTAEQPISRAFSRQGAFYAASWSPKPPAH